MLRLVVRTFMIALALVGLGTVVGWAWSPLRKALPAPNTITVVASPEGEFKAILASWHDGGAISPSCDTKVFVVPKATAADQAISDENLVFASDCGSVSPENCRVLHSPELSWRDARVLLVRFSTLATAAMPAEFRLRRLTANSQVTVEFEVGH